MVQITLQLPDELAKRLAPFQDRLLELLEQGWREILNDPAEDGLDAREIIELLASQPRNDNNYLQLDNILANFAFSTDLTKNLNIYPIN